MVNEAVAMWEEIRERVAEHGEDDTIDWLCDQERITLAVTLVLAASC